MSGRIVTYLDKGLGWTLPVVVACCRSCGTELARHRKQHVAERTARRTRCPACGTRGAWRLPATTSPASDLALASGRAAWSDRRQWPQTATQPLGFDALKGGEPHACFSLLAARC